MHGTESPIDLRAKSMATRFPVENLGACAGIPRSVQNGLKRGLNGTYISVEPIHLDAYVNEQVFRFNLRHKEHTDATRFKAVLKDVVGRRLTYAQLTGRTASSAS